MVFRPTTFGKYFLTRRIAVGGMAEVFSAKLYGADGFEKDLVIKQILPQHARDPEFVQSFVAEAKIAVSLSHANIVAIYELGRVDGTYFIAMELVDGLDVYALLEAAKRYQEPVGIGEAVLVVEQVAQGLDYAHRRRDPAGRPLELVHRDLNPRNVLISHDGDAKILDFGIAKTASHMQAMPKTRAGVVKGTSGYMSPEQAMGYPIDARTDIYQAGLLMYELLTGVPLFWRPDDNATRELMRQHRVVPPSQLVSDVPRELDLIVLNALAWRPDERLQSAHELAGRLAQLRRSRYPETSHESLGGLIRTMQGHEAAMHTTQDALPLEEGADLKEIITQAIEQTITGNVETIAQAPMLQELPKVPPPRTGSTPIAMEIQLPESRPSESAPPRRSSSPLPPPLFDLARALEEPSDGALLPPKSPAPLSTGQRWLAAGVFLALGVALGGLGWMLLAGAQAPSTPPAAEPTPPAAAPKAPPAQPATPKPAPAQPAASAPSTQPKATAPKATAPPAARAAQPAIVDFGTRSCSSRVIVDGEVLTRATPSYGHRLDPGWHRVVFRGTECPPVERPGSVKRARPAQSTKIRLRPGQRVKLIADYDAGLILKR